MRIMVFKLTNKKIFFMISILVLVIIMILIFILKPNNATKKQYATSEIGEYFITVKDNDDRIKFLQQFGWDVDENPTETNNVLIPGNFNSIFENYNNIQKQQGLDLSEYKGQQCERYTYKIKNYPKESETVYADILVSNEKVIGGDICSGKHGGFLHGFCSPQN